MTVLELDTPRFGPLVIEEAEVWEFPYGVIGLPECRRFTRVPFPDAAVPFEWLQCLDDVAVAFLVADPVGFFPDYAVALPPEELATIDLTTQADSAIRCIVTVTDHVADMTANLLGPLVLNQPKRLGMQVVLSHPAYATQHRLFPEATTRAGTEPTA